MSKLHANLIEPTMAKYTKIVLQKCKETRYKYNSILLNIGMVAILIGVIGCILYYSKKSKEEQELHQEERNTQKEIYIMDTLRKIKAMEKQRRDEMIQNIPYQDKNIYMNI